MTLFFPGESEPRYDRDPSALQYMLTFQSAHMGLVGTVALTSFRPRPSEVTNAHCLERRGRISHSLVVRCIGCGVTMPHTCVILSMCGGPCPPFDGRSAARDKEIPGLCAEMLAHGIDFPARDFVL